jgi:catecholate siderophore receptor
VNIGTLRLDHRFSDQLSLRNTLRYSRADRESAVTAPRIAGTPPPTTPLASIVINRGRPTRERTEDIMGNQTDLTARFETFGFKHTLVTGLEIGRETFNITRFAQSNVPTATFYNPNPVPDTSGMTRAVSSIVDTTAFEFAMFASETIKLLPQLDIVGGLRWDLFDADAENRTTSQAFSRTDQKWTYRAGLEFHPWPTHSYYCAYGTSFNPSAEGLALAANAAGTPPEENESFEIGGKIDLMEGALSLQGALFRIDKTNARTPDPITGLQVLETEQRMQGVEFGVTGRLLPAWNIFAGYTYLDSEILKSLEVVSGASVVGNKLPNTPKHSFSFWTANDFLDRWQVRTGIFYVDEHFANNANTNVLPSAVRWDMTVGYQRPANWAR